MKGQPFPKGLRGRRPGRLGTSLALGACALLLWDVSNLSSLAGRNHPYYQNPSKTGLMFAYAAYEAEMDEPVWARPSMPGILVKSKGLPIEPNVRLTMAHLYEELGLPQKSLELYEQVIGDSQGGLFESLGLFALQRLFYETGDYGRTVSSLDLVQKYDRPAELATARYLAGQAYIKLSSPARAIPVLEAVPEQSKEAPFARYSLGLAYTQESKSALAQKAFEQAIALGQKAVNPRRVPVVKLDGTRESRIVEAALYPEERTALEGLIAKSNLALGYLFVQSKKYAEAGQAFSQVPEKDAYYPEALYARAWAQIYQRELVQAIVTLSKLIKVAPASKFAHEAYLVIGSCYVNLKLYDKAIQAYQAAIDRYNEERALFHKVVDEGFLRQRFDALRLYFDPDASNRESDPLAKLGEEDEGIFGRLVTNTDVREWFARHSEVAGHLRRLRNSTQELQYRTALIDQKLEFLGNFEGKLDKGLGGEVARAGQEWQLLDDRINLRNQTIDIWQLASRKETEKLKDYQRRLTELDKISRTLKDRLSKAGQLTPEEQELADQTRQRVDRLKKLIELLRGQMAWEIVGSANVTGGGVQRGGLGRGTDQTALYNRELAKLKTLLERAQAKVRLIRQDAIEFRTHYTDMRQRSQALSGRVNELLASVETYYLGLSDKVIDAVTEISRESDRRLERFVAEAEFGVIGALDRQAAE
ncbi:MAG: tetratricopeptide repeat protein [Bdellovibrionota bacterium]